MSPEMTISSIISVLAVVTIGLSVYTVNQQMVLMTQYFDTPKAIGADSKNSSVLIPHTPGAISDFMQQIQNSIVTANQIQPK